MTASKPKLRVLVVDDEPSIATLHAHFVRMHPEFEISAVTHSGGDALKEIESNPPDVVLLDFGLPDIDGREVLRRIRASNRASIEVIALTASNDLESVRYARSAGVRHYLVKPFDPAVLRQRLDRVLQEHEAYGDVVAERLQQQQVDALLQVDSSVSAVKPLPKGLGAETLERVRRVLVSAPTGTDFSTSEIAQTVGTSRATARRYLEFLCQIGEAQVEPKYGSVGRPENRYAAAPKPGAVRAPTTPRG